jgi:hypothetical protein
LGDEIVAREFGFFIITPEGESAWNTKGIAVDGFGQLRCTLNASTLAVHKKTAATNALNPGVRRSSYPPLQADPAPFPPVGPGMNQANRRTQLQGAISSLQLSIKNDEDTLLVANIGIPVLQLARDEAYRATQDPRRSGVGATLAYITADALLSEGIADRNRIEMRIRNNREQLRRLENDLRNLSPSDK